MKSPGFAQEQGAEGAWGVVGGGLETMGNKMVGTEGWHRGSLSRHAGNGGSVSLFTASSLPALGRNMELCRVPRVAAGGRQLPAAPHRAAGK